MRYALLSAGKAIQSNPSPLSVAILLRGGTGAGFDGYAGVLRGAPHKNFQKRFLPCTYDERYFISHGEVLKYVLLKGSSCFVYGDLTDPSPNYAGITGASIVMIGCA